MCVHGGEEVTEDAKTGECIKLNSQLHEDISLKRPKRVLTSALLCPYCVTIAAFLHRTTTTLGGPCRCGQWSESRVEISTLLQIVDYCRAVRIWMWSEWLTLVHFDTAEIVWQASSIIRYLFASTMSWRWW